MKWFECSSCGEEFRVICDSGTLVEYCPFCSEPIEESDDEIDMDTFDEEDY